MGVERFKNSAPNSLLPLTVETGGAVGGGEPEAVGAHTHGPPLGAAYTKVAAGVTAAYVLAVGLAVLVEDMDHARRLQLGREGDG